MNLFHNFCFHLVCCHGTWWSWIFWFSKRHEYLTRAKLLLARIIDLFSFRTMSGFCRIVGNLWNCGILSGLNCFSARFLWKSRTVYFCARLLACGVVSRALMWILCSCEPLVSPNGVLIGMWLKGSRFLRWKLLIF